MNIKDLVEYSVHFYLKSGKVLASDPVEIECQESEKRIEEVWGNFADPSWVGSYLVRNGHLVLIPKDAIDYLEFHADVI